MAPKVVNPLDLLPPSSFNLFDFKTLLVNAADKKEAIKFLFDNFDSNGYSVYQVKYVKAEGEGKILYQTNNLMNGFIQRLDHFRKYSIGVHGVYGEEPDLDIKGVWLWRGVGLPKEITDLDSFEFHTWEKLDLSCENHQKILEQYWVNMQEGDIVEGSKTQCAKYFK